MAQDQNSDVSKEQVAIAQAMTKAMQEMLAVSRQLETSFSNQSKAFRDICDAMDCVKKSGDESISALNGLRDAQNEVSDAGSTTSEDIRRAGEELDRVSDEAKKADGGFRKFKDSIIKVGKSLSGPFAAGAKIAAGALHGITSGLKFYYKVASSGLGIMGSVAKGIFNIGRSILSVPISLYKGLLNMANNGTSGISELAQALNELKEDFGALSGPTNSAIVGMANSMGNLSKSGVNVFRAFGTVAERIKVLGELFKSAGPNFRSFSEEMMKNDGSIAVFAKGLGLGGEQLESLALRAKAAGKELTETMIDITKYSTSMAKAFKLDAKIISREMGKAAQDMKHFGNISEKQIGVAVTYAQKLGIQLDSITGSFDKFATFDDAAENISKLNEAFGTNIDVGEIMAEQDPTKQFEMIRKGLRAAGVEGDKLTHAQRRMLQATTGWDDATSIAALSTENQATSLEDIQKEADKAEKKTVSQTDAIKELTGAIKENLKAMNPPAGKGFWDRFKEGMMFGINSHPKVRALMNNIRGGFMEAFVSGRKFSTFMLNNIPGVGKVLDGLAAVFNPAKFKILFGGITKNFEDFVKRMKTNPKEAFKQLMKDIKSTFINFFSKEAPEGRQIGDGIKDFLKFIVSILSGLVPLLMEALAKGLTAIANFISNPKKYIEAAKAKAKAEVGKPGGGDSIMSPLIVSISEAWPTLKQAFIDLWNAIKTWLAPFGDKIKAQIVHWLGARALLGGLQAVGQMAISGNLPNIFKGVLGKAAIIGLIVDAGINVSKSLKEFGPMLQKEGFDPATANIAAGTTGLINTLTLGLLPPGLQKQIAIQVAKAADALFKAVEEYFGPQMAQGLKSLLEGTFLSLGGIGDIVVGLFSGDNLKIDEGVNNLVEGLFKIFEGAIDMLGSAAEKLIDLLILAVEYIFTGLIPKIPYLASKLVEVFFRILKTVFELLGKVASKIEQSPILRVLLGIFTLGLSEVFILLGPLFTKIGQLFGAFADAYNWLAEQVKGLSWDQITKDFREFFEFLGKDISEAWTSIKTSISETIESIKVWFRDLWGDITYPFKEAWRIIVEVWDSITTSIGEAIDSIGETLTEIYNYVAVPLGQAWDYISKIPERLAAWGDETLDSITKPFKDGWTWLTENFSFDKFLELGGQILDGIMGGIGSIGGKIKETFSDAVSGVKSFLGISSPSKVFKGIGSNMSDGLMENIENISDTVEESVGKVVPKIDRIVEKITESVRTNFNKVFDLVQEITDKVLSYLETNVPRGLEVFKTFKNGVMELFGFDSFYKIFEGVVNGVKNALGKLGELPIFGEIITFAKKVFQTHSPSKVFEDIGDNLAAGLEGGMSSMTDIAGDIFGSITKSAKEIELPADLLPDILKGHIQRITKFASSLTEASNAVSNFTAAGMFVAVDAVNDIIEASKKLEESLAKGASLNIDTKLKTFASQFGKNLGSSGGYTVKTRDIILNVSFKVAIDAQELEGAIINTSGSKIKERINLIIDALPDTDYAKAQANSAQAYRL